MRLAPLAAHVFHHGVSQGLVEFQQNMLEILQFEDFPQEHVTLESRHSQKLPEQEAANVHLIACGDRGHQSAANIDKSPALLHALRKRGLVIELQQLIDVPAAEICMDGL